MSKPFTPVLNRTEHNGRAARPSGHAARQWCVFQCAVLKQQPSTAPV